jgi:non-specific serine/threonine protein kinase
LDGLQSLTDKSLLRQHSGPNGEPRFFLLETIHEYARELLNEKLDSKAIRQRHCDYFVDLARRVAPEMLYRADSSLWWRILDAEIENLHAALAWAFSDGDALQGCRLLGSLHFYWVNEPWREIMTWECEALRCADALEPLDRARLYLALGRGGEGRRDIEDVRMFYADAMKLSQAAGEDRVSIGAMINLAGTYLGDRGNYDHAMTLCRRALHQARAADQAQLTIRALNVTGLLAAYSGDNDDMAAQALEEALGISREVGDRRRTTMLLLNLGDFAERRGEHHAAEKLAVEALRTARELEDRTLTATGLENTALAATAAGRSQRGARLLGAADRACEVIGLVRAPVDQPEYDRALTTLTQQLQPEELDALIAERRAMTRSEAVTYALDEHAG